MAFNNSHIYVGKFLVHICNGQIKGVKKVIRTLESSCNGIWKKKTDAASSLDITLAPDNLNVSSSNVGM